MSKRKWALGILLIILVAGYLKLFYKTWSEKAVPASADCVVALDIKRITNTLLWNLVTTPSQWKIGKFLSKKARDTSWRDMVNIPDYVLAFHSKAQPANAWYLLLDINSHAGFEAGLKKFGFEKLSSNEFASKTAGIYLFVNNDKVLAGKARVEDSSLVRQVAKELFTEKKFISRKELQKAIDAKSHLAVYVASNDLLQETGIVTANFDKEKIKIAGTFIPDKRYSFKEENFIYPSGSLCVLGCTQPSPAVFNLLNKSSLSRSLSMDVDSVFIQSNTSYSLNLQEIKERTDSAITYTYDDEFNKVEKLVVNNIQEPSFSFFINGQNISPVYDYLQRNNKLESTANGDVFLPMPLVRSYCRKRSESSLSITAFNYGGPKADSDTRAILFFRLSLTKIPKNLFRYLPDDITKSLSNMDEINLSVNQKNEQLHITGMLTKRKNSLSLFQF
ncbi:MAG: hypothetical protein IPP96_06055 [Chitinophagaceae bacterium]|nr:hypothetical protein [Chitinophagaceae bacterium]